MHIFLLVERDNVLCIHILLKYAIVMLKQSQKVHQFSQRKEKSCEATKTLFFKPIFNHLIVTDQFPTNVQSTFSTQYSSDKLINTCFRNLTFSTFQAKSAMRPSCRMFKFVLMCVSAHLNNYINDEQQSKMSYQYSCINSPYVLYSSSSKYFACIFKSNSSLWI